MGQKEKFSLAWKQRGQKLKALNSFTLSKGILRPLLLPLSVAYSHLSSPVGEWSEKVHTSEPLQSQRGVSSSYPGSQGARASGKQRLPAPSPFWL